MLLTDEMIFLVFLGSGATLIVTIGLIIFFFKYNRKILEIKIEKQRELLEAEIKGKEAEQARIGRGIHDELAGDLVAINIGIQTLQSDVKENPDLDQRLGGLKDLVNKIHKDIRRVSRDLLANDIEVFGLDYALNELLEHSMVNDYHVSVPSDIQLKQEQKLAIYRVLQEILNNAIKHSDCNTFSISCELGGSEQVIKIEFDGKTFDWEKTKLESKGMGLKNIESRVDYIGGRLTYSNANNRNLYKITIPVDE